MHRRNLWALRAIASLTAISLPAFAQGPGWTVKSTVVQLVVTSNGGVNVRLSPDLTNCVSQSGYGGSFASIYPSHAGIDRMKADLLVAMTSNLPVMLYLNDANCTVTEMRLGGM